MKKYISLSALLLLLTLKMSAQQIPLYSQMYFMRMLYNPALTAYNGSSNLHGFYREQWTAQPGHPVTRGAVGDISLWQDRIGTGFHVYNDNTDIIHRVSAQIYYAQKIRFAKDHVLSLGVSGGIMQTRLDFDNVVAKDAGDGHLLLTDKSAMAFDMNVGLAYQWKKLTVGFSIPQVLNTNARITSQLKDSKYSMKRNFIGSVSYEISIKKETYNIEPSILIKKGAAQPVQVDANVTANYKRIVYLGVGYRLDYGLSMMAAVRIAKAVTIGYGYDFPIQKNVEYSSTKGTHEVIFGLNFDRWIKKKSPEKAEQFAKQSQYDSLTAVLKALHEKIDSTGQKADSIQITLDSLSQKSIKDNEQLNELNNRLADMQSTLKEYKDKLSTNAVRNFPYTVDQSTTAASGEVLRLNSVNFQRNSSDMEEGSYAELDKVATFLKNNAKMHIRVLGHTDHKASDEYNDWLSKARAKKVQDYLIGKGVPANRIVHLGMGKRAPIADNETEEGRAKNRRVEIEIINKE